MSTNVHICRDLYSSIYMNYEKLNEINQDHMPTIGLSLCP